MKGIWIQNIYVFYDRLAVCLLGKKSELLQDLTIMKTRALLILWTSTTIVMWFYVLYCFFAFPSSSPVPWGGLFLTIFHSLSPLIFKYTQSFVITGLTISLTGLGFQTLFCIYTGGVYSPAAIWLTFHPVILGFFGSMGWIAFSVTLNFFIVIALYLAGKMNMLPPDLLLPLFRDGMIITSYVGLDVLVAIFTIMAIKLNLKKNDELQRSRDLTENLVRVLCHDINTPLSIIQVSGRQIHPVKNPNTPIFAEKIVRASSDIHRIIQSVSSWIAHRDGKMKLKHQLITVKEIIEHLHFAFEDKLKEKNLTLLIHCDCENHAIWGDKTAVFYQVFNNLLSNAIKFSHENSKIEVHFYRENDLLHVGIRDHGVGIDNELIDKVFSPYAVTTSPGTKNEKGTGFGLPIVATVVEKMEGKVTIENMAFAGEQGTRVNLLFPLHS